MQSALDASEQLHDIGKLSRPLALRCPRVNGRQRYICEGGRGREGPQRVVAAQ